MTKRAKSSQVSNIFCIPSLSRYILHLPNFLLKVKKLEDLLVWVEYTGKISWEKLPAPVRYYFSQSNCDSIDIKYSNKEYIFGIMPDEQNYKLDMYLIDMLKSMIHAQSLYDIDFKVHFKKDYNRLLKTYPEFWV